MNGISWLIYFANVCGNLGGVLFALVFLSLALTIALILYGGVERDHAYPGDERHNAAMAIQGKALRFGIPTAVLILFLSVLVPSQDTVYAIAASETGERVLKTDTGNKAVAALNAWLDRQINPQPAPAADKK